MTAFAICVMVSLISQKVTVTVDTRQVNLYKEYLNIHATENIPGVK